MKNNLLFLLLIISAPIQAMNPSRKRTRDERPQTVAQILNRVEHEIVGQIYRGAPAAESSLNEFIYRAAISWQQANQPEFEFSEQECEDVKRHFDWLRTLQKLHFPESIPAAVAQPEDKNETPEQQTQLKKHRLDPDGSESL